MKDFLKFASWAVFVFFVWNSYYYFVNDSLLFGPGDYGQGRDHIQVIDFLFLGALGFLALFWWMIGLIWKKGAPRLPGRSIRDAEREKFEEEENKIW